MKNNQLKNAVKTIVADPNLVVAKGIIGGQSIEVFYDEPYADFGSFVYKTVEDRDADFAELEKIIIESKTRENV